MSSQIRNIVFVFVSFAITALMALSVQPRVTGSTDNNTPAPPGGRSPTQASTSCLMEEIPYLQTLSRSLNWRDCRDPFDTNDYADLYLFRLSEVSQVTIAARSQSFIAHLRLVSGDQNSYGDANDDDYISFRKAARLGQQATITRPLPPGTYQIIVSEFSRGRRSGAYGVSIVAESLFTSSTPTRQDKQRVIYQTVFGGNFGTFSSYRLETNRYLAGDTSAFNQVCRVGGVGRHYGWDMQTEDAAASYGRADRSGSYGKIFSLTDGQVIKADTTRGTVAVRHGTDTIYYLHLDQVAEKYHGANEQAVYISAGAYLGREGRKGATTAPHLHLEVRTSDHTGGLCSSTGHRDPTEYFYEIISDDK